MTHDRAPIGATLALTIAAVVALFGLAAPLAHAVIAPTALAPPFTEQNQDTETLLFVLTFAVLLPAALVFVPRVADRIAAAEGAPALGGLAAALTVALVGLLVLVKVSERLPWGDGLGVLATASGLWCLLAAATTGAVATGGRRLPAPLARWAGALWLTALALVAVLVLCFVQIGSIDVVVLVAGALLVSGAVAWLIPRVPRATGPWGMAADAAAVVLLLLAVPNVVIFTFGSPAAEVENTILQFHQNFFLGPANQVLGGGAMLVDTLSQYGVGSIYFLAGWPSSSADRQRHGRADRGPALGGHVHRGAYAVLRIAGTSPAARRRRARRRRGRPRLRPPVPDRRAASARGDPLRPRRSGSSSPP